MLQKKAFNKLPYQKFCGEPTPPPNPPPNPQTHTHTECIIHYISPLSIAFVAVPLLQYIIITTQPTPTVLGEQNTEYQLAYVFIQYMSSFTYPLLSFMCLGTSLQTHFTQWPVIEGCSPSHIAYVTHRHQHFPQLHVRMARYHTQLPYHLPPPHPPHPPIPHVCIYNRVEDSDELMVIFKEYTHHMTENYG